MTRDTSHGWFVAALVALACAGITDPLCPDDGFGPSVEPLPRLTLPVQVLVDGVEAQVPYAGSAPGLVFGVDHYNVIPTNNRQARRCRYRLA